MRDGNMQASLNAEPPFRRLRGVTLRCRPRPSPFGGDVVGFLLVALASSSDDLSTAIALPSQHSRPPAPGESVPNDARPALSAFLLGTSAHPSMHEPAPEHAARYFGAGRGRALLAAESLTVFPVCGPRRIAMPFVKISDSESSSKPCVSCTHLTALGMPAHMPAHTSNPLSPHSSQERDWPPSAAGCFGAG